MAYLTQNKTLIESIAHDYPMPDVYVEPIRSHFLELYLNQKHIAAQRLQHKKRDHDKNLPWLMRDVNRHQAELAEKEALDSHYQALYVSDYFIAKAA